jgi:hypothetical protein
MTSSPPSQGSADTDIYDVVGIIDTSNSEDKQYEGLSERMKDK